MSIITWAIDFLVSEFWGASVIHWLMPLVAFFGIATMLALFRKRNLVKKDTMCPVRKKQVTLGLDANVFRDPSKTTGLDVTACTEFLDGKVTCGKDCLHNPDVQAMHAEEKCKHQEDMRRGNTVIP